MRSGKRSREPEERSAALWRIRGSQGRLELENLQEGEGSEGKEAGHLAVRYLYVELGVVAMVVPSLMLAKFHHEIQLPNIKPTGFLEGLVFGGSECVGVRAVVRLFGECLQDFTFAIDPDERVIRGVSAEICIPPISLESRKTDEFFSPEFRAGIEDSAPDLLEAYDDLISAYERNDPVVNTPTFVSTRCEYDDIRFGPIA